jgi:Tol biopolymer transport system component
MKSFRRALAGVVLALAAVSWAQDFEVEKKAVVKISSQADGVNRVGTGFIAKIDGDSAYIVTASHVIEGDTRPMVAFYPDVTRTLPATIIGTEGDLPRGLALIRVDGPLPKNLEHLGIDSSFNLQASEQVTIIGFPRLAATAWAVTPITIVGRQGTAITFTGAADEGSSGSPVIRNGWVTAIVAEKSGDFGFAVPAAAMRFALEGWGLKLTPDAAITHSKQATAVLAHGELAKTRILFTSTRDMDTSGNNLDLFVMNVDGTNVKRVPDGFMDSEAASWSRDGQSMLFVTNEDPKTAGIYQADLATGKTTKISKVEGYFEAPLYSPDGSLIAFFGGVSIDVDYLDIFTITSSGTNLKRLTHRPSKKITIFWSPDGSKIGFAEIVDKHYRTSFVSVDGTKVEPLSTPLTDFAGEAWSGANGKILGESNHEGYEAVYMMNSDGSDPVRLTSTPQGDADADWSPDGTRIVFTSLRDGHAEIYVMNGDGSNQVRLTNTTAKSFNPQWSPFPR